MAVLVGLAVAMLAAVGWGVRRAQRQNSVVPASAAKAAAAGATAARARAAEQTAGQIAEAATDRQPAVAGAVRRNLPETPPPTVAISAVQPAGSVEWAGSVDTKQAAESEPAEQAGRHRVDDALTGSLDAAAVRAALDAGNLDLNNLPRVPPRRERAAS